MKISRKVECGIIAMVDIALYSGNGESVTVYSISKRQGISVKYIEQILPSLKQANLIQGMKGCRGGYVLSKAPERTTLREIIDALDITILNDLSVDGGGGSASTINRTVYECFWRKATEELQKSADKITLKFIMNKCREATAESKGNFMYYI